MTDKQHITLRLAAHNVSLDIPREQEQSYREAGDFLNQRYLLYAQRMPKASAEQIWLYVALEAALNWKTAARSKSLEPVEKRIDELNALLHKALTESKQPE
mgnify:CR=1 FL=1